MDKLARFPIGTLLGLGLLAMAFAVPSALPRAKAQAQGVKSKIKVTLPQEDAELLIESKATKTMGLTREYDTPALEAGKRYEYTFLARWRPNNFTVMTRPRTVQFTAGEEVVVDLSKDSADGKDKAEIRYVQTPEEIVDEMIKLAKITKEDVVFEPGCGDGRVVIAAVKAGAKKGVGIDLDKDRVKESKAAAKAASLLDKIEIREGDALEVKDYADATVVMLYMGDEFNLLLRPILLRDLKVGSRIVSHRFTMKDWKPDETKKTVGTDGLDYEVHIWKVTEEAKKKYAAPEKK
jgi:uncharacterized protein (TIGR03000 family)